MQGQVLGWVDSVLPQQRTVPAVYLILCEGNQSAPADVLSGVPQGTALCPLLFLAYTNGMPEVVSSNPRLFADDALVYRKITCQEDSDKLWKDLNVLQDWE